MSSTNTHETLYPAESGQNPEWIENSSAVPRKVFEGKVFYK